jgi:hypothetical protein
MQSSKPGITDTLVATAATSKYRFIDGAGALCAAGGKAYGVSQIDAEMAGDPLSVGVTGVLLVFAGASITAGQEVQSDATGRAIPLASGKPNGVSRDSVSAGDLCRVALR